MRNAESPGAAMAGGGTIDKWIVGCMDGQHFFVLRAAAGWKAPTHPAAPGYRNALAGSDTLRLISAKQPRSEEGVCLMRIRFLHR